MRNPQVLGGLGVFKWYGAAFPMAFSLPSLKYSLPRGLWNMKEDVVSLGVDTHIKCLVHIPCISLLYLNIKILVICQWFCPSKKCCGHN